MNNIPGTIYLLHFSQPYQHARHYTGWALNLADRLAAHEQGRGSRLLAVAKAAGIGFTLARTTTGDRFKERAIKNAGGQVRYCPLCTSQPRKGRWA
jgi:predicted GIY-YIG superfamily endonuclease